MGSHQVVGPCSNRYAYKLIKRKGEANQKKSRQTKEHSHKIVILIAPEASLRLRHDLT